MKTLVIIPAFNEEESLEPTIDRLTAVNPACDYIIINDGSKDHTADICRANGYPFIDLPVNLGLSGAFQAGMKYALKHHYDCAIQFDADGQHRPEYIEQLANATKQYDIAIGSRFVNANKPISGRMLGSNLIQAIIKLTTGVTISDPTSGMRALNAKTIALLANDFNFGPEPDTLSCLIKRRGITVTEVPVIMDERTAGESYLSPIKAAKYMLRMTISILFIQWFRK